VDGTGLQRIEDEGVAQQLLEKVNKFNSDTNRNVLIASVAFAALSIPLHGLLRGF